MRRSTVPAHRRPAEVVSLLAAGVLMFVPQVAGAGDVALGEYLASECVTCHQASGQTVAGVPSIVVVVIVAP